MDTHQWEAGQIIENAREKRGMSKRNAARAIGMSESWWRKMELGHYIYQGEPRDYRPAADALAKAAHLVGVNPTTILRAGGYTGHHNAELPTMRTQAHALVNELADEQLPAAVAYLTGLRDGLAQR